MPEPFSAPLSTITHPSPDLQATTSPNHKTSEEATPSTPPSQGTKEPSSHARLTSPEPIIPDSSTIPASSPPSPITPTHLTHCTTSTTSPDGPVTSNSSSIVGCSDDAVNNMFGGILPRVHRRDSVPEEEEDEGLYRRAAKIAIFDGESEIADPPTSDGEEDKNSVPPTSTLGFTEFDPTPYDLAEDEFQVGSDSGDMPSLIPSSYHHDRSHQQWLDDLSGPHARSHDIDGDCSNFVDEPSIEHGNEADIDEHLYSASPIRPQTSTRVRQRDHEGDIDLASDPQPTTKSADESKAFPQRVPYPTHLPPPERPWVSPPQIKILALKRRPQSYPTYLPPPERPGGVWDSSPQNAADHDPSSSRHSGSGLFGCSTSQHRHHRPNTSTFHAPLLLHSHSPCCFLNPQYHSTHFISHDNEGDDTTADDRQHNPISSPSCDVTPHTRDRGYLPLPAPRDAQQGSGNASGEDRIFVCRTTSELIRMGVLKRKGKLEFEELFRA